MGAGGDAIACAFSELRLNPWCTSTSKSYLAANLVILSLSGGLVRAARRKAGYFDGRDHSRSAQRPLPVGNVGFSIVVVVVVVVIVCCVCRLDPMVRGYYRCSSRLIVCCVCKLNIPGRRSRASIDLVSRRVRYYRCSWTHTDDSDPPWMAWERPMYLFVRTG
jgi:hypothetical protein